MSIHVRSFAPALTVVAVMSGGVAFAQSSDGETVDHTEIGALTCEVEDTSKLIALKQARTLDCVFDPAQDGLADEAYVGEITRFGLSLGGTQKGVMSWLVLAPTERSAQEPGLNGTYRGVSAQATLGVGVEGNVMVGGEEKLTLQPISLGAQTGVNLALGVGNIKLARVEG